MSHGALGGIGTFRVSRLPTPIGNTENTRPDPPRKGRSGRVHATWKEGYRLMTARAPDTEALLTPAEVAALFKVDTKTVARWAKGGKIHPVRTLGGHRRYREEEISALLRGELWEPPAGVVAEQYEPDPLAAPVHTLWPRVPASLGAAVRGRLHVLGITTVGGLTGRTAKQLADLGLPGAEVEEVRRVLFRRGLALRGEITGDVA